MTEKDHCSGCLAESNSGTASSLFIVFIPSNWSISYGHSWAPVNVNALWFEECHPHRISYKKTHSKQRKWQIHETIIQYRPNYLWEARHIIIHIRGVIFVYSQQLMSQADQSISKKIKMNPHLFDLTLNGDSDFFKLRGEIMYFELDITLNLLQALTFRREVNSIADWEMPRRPQESG